MRTVRYKTSWSYLGSGTKREEELVDFVLDILYLMEGTGVVPPLHVLNEVLSKGSTGGGMGPGTSWKPFKLPPNEYSELVEALCALDVIKAKVKHPYIRFNEIIVDDELDQSEDYIQWLRASTLKHKK